MKIDNACVECILNQSRRVTEAIRADDALSRRMLARVEALGKHFDFTQSPPEVASDVYEQMAEMAGMEDLYGELKAHATEKARTFLPQLHQEIAASSDKLLTAIKIAVAGNVIDLAAEVTFDLHEEMAKIFETNFAHDDVEQLARALEKAKTLLYIGDNVGEHIFDKMIHVLLYVQLHWAGPASSSSKLSYNRKLFRVLSRLGARLGGAALIFTETRKLRTGLSC